MFYVFFQQGRLKMIFFYISFQDFFNKILLFFSIRVILYGKAFKYMLYKKVFLDENPKTRFSDMKKIQKASEI